MPLILIDGMEDVSSWVTSGGFTNPTGRHGKCVSTTGSNTLSFNPPAADQYDTLTVGFAVNIVSAVGTAFNVVLFASDVGTVIHQAVRVNTDLSLNVMRGGNLLAATPASIITTGAWFYIEFSSRLHDTLGTYTLKINGTTVLSATNVDTKNGGTKTVLDQVRLSGQGGVTVQWDDLYVHGGAQDAFQGDITVETLYPSGNGNANQWLGSDADSVNNYLLVNEVGTPVTTTYVLSSVAGQQDLYALTDLVAASGAVLGVTHAVYAMKTDAGARDLKLVSRGAADSKSAAVGLTTTYGGYHYTLTNNPETGLPWTIAQVNALQGGVEAV